MEVHCTYHDRKFETDETFYRCVISKQQIPEDKVFKFNGNHQDEKTNDDVTYVEFRYCTITRVPQGLTKIFPNLTFLEIFESQLHSITKADMAEYQHLEKFICRNNEIEFLSGDLFEDFKHLQYISFNGNKLQIIEPNILDGLHNIKHVDFFRNSNYDKCFSIYKNTNANATLEEVKNQLFERFFSSDPESVKNFIDKPHQPMVKIFKELQQLKNAEVKLNEVVQEMRQEFEIMKLEKMSMEKKLQKEIDNLTEQLKTNETNDEVEPLEENEKL